MTQQVNEAGNLKGPVVQESTRERERERETEKRERELAM
jgi:hypothetical protein